MATLKPTAVQSIGEPPLVALTRSLRDGLKTPAMIQISAEALEPIKHSAIPLDTTGLSNLLKLFEGAQARNCAQLDPHCFFVLVQIFLKLKPCLAQERALYQFTAYLRDLTDKALIVLAKSDVEGQNVFALADQRKASIGQKVIPYIARKLQEQKAKGRLRQQVFSMLFQLLRQCHSNKHFFVHEPSVDSRILGHALLEDPHYPTRIVAADTLREIGTSMKDIRAFWPEHTPDKVVSGFPYADLADSSWLRGLVDLLRRLDSHRQFAKNSRPMIKTAIESIRIGDVSLEDATGEFMVLGIVFDEVTFAIPATNARGLQFVELPTGSIASHASEDADQPRIAPGDGRVIMRTTLNSDGCYVMNGTKRAADELSVVLQKLRELDAFWDLINERLEIIKKEKEHGPAQKLHLPVAESQIFNSQNSIIGGSDNFEHSAGPPRASSQREWEEGREVIETAKEFEDTGRAVQGAEIEVGDLQLPATGLESAVGNVDSAIDTGAVASLNDTLKISQPTLVFSKLRQHNASNPPLLKVADSIRDLGNVAKRALDLQTEAEADFPRNYEANTEEDEVILLPAIPIGKGQPASQIPREAVTSQTGASQNNASVLMPKMFTKVAGNVSQSSTVNTVPKAASKPHISVPSKRPATPPIDRRQPLSKRRPKVYSSASKKDTTNWNLSSDKESESTAAKPSKTASQPKAKAAAKKPATQAAPQPKKAPKKTGPLSKSQPAKKKGPTPSVASSRARRGTTTKAPVKLATLDGREGSDEEAASGSEGSSGSAFEAPKAHRRGERSKADKPVQRKSTKAQPDVASKATAQKETDPEVAVGVSKFTGVRDSQEGKLTTNLRPAATQSKDGENSQMLNLQDHEVDSLLPDFDDFEEATAAEPRNGLDPTGAATRIRDPEADKSPETAAVVVHDSYPMDAAERHTHSVGTKLSFGSLISSALAGSAAMPPPPTVPQHSSGLDDGATFVASIIKAQKEQARSRVVPTPTPVTKKAAQLNDKKGGVETLPSVKGSAALRDAKQKTRKTEGSTLNSRSDLSGLLSNNLAPAPTPAKAGQDALSKISSVKASGSSSVTPLLDANDRQPKVTSENEAPSHAILQGGLEPDHGNVIDDNQTSMKPQPAIIQLAPEEVPHTPQRFQQSPQEINGLLDERYNRKAHIINFSAQGPRNQGTTPKTRAVQDLAEGTDLPAETAKHEAYKRSKQPGTATSTPAPKRRKITHHESLEQSDDRAALEDGMTGDSPPARVQEALGNTIEEDQEEMLAVEASDMVEVSPEMLKEAKPNTAHEERFEWLQMDQVELLEEATTEILEESKNVPQEEPTRDDKVVSQLSQSRVTEKGSPRPVSTRFHPQPSLHSTEGSTTSSPFASSSAGSVKMQHVQEEPGFALSRRPLPPFLPQAQPPQNRSNRLLQDFSKAPPPVLAPEPILSLPQPTEPAPSLSQPLRSKARNPLPPPAQLSHPLYKQPKLAPLKPTENLSEVQRTMALQQHNTFNGQCPPGTQQTISSRYIITLGEKSPAHDRQQPTKVSLSHTEASFETLLHNTNGQTSAVNRQPRLDKTSRQSPKQQHKHVQIDEDETLVEPESESEDNHRQMQYLVQQGHSSTSERSEDFLPKSKDHKEELKTWRSDLGDPRRRTLDMLMDVANQAMFHLQDEETAIQSKVTQYDQGGKGLVELLSRSHNEGIKQHDKELMPTRRKLLNMLQYSADQLGAAKDESSKQMKVRQLEKDIDKRYTPLQASLAAAMEQCKVHD